MVVYDVPLLAVDHHNMHFKDIGMQVCISHEAMVVIRKKTHMKNLSLFGSSENLNTVEKTLNVN